MCVCGKTKFVHTQAGLFGHLFSLASAWFPVLGARTHMAASPPPTAPQKPENASSVYAGIYDPFPSRVLKFFFVTPKRTEPAKNLVECMRRWVADTFGDNMLRECSSGIASIGAHREAVVWLGDVAPSSPESMANFHHLFEDRYAKPAFAYFRLLSEFVTKTRGTAAAKGLNGLELYWYHPFDTSLGRVETDQLNYELCAVLWNLAAAFSVCAAFLPRVLQTKCSLDADGGAIEPVECLRYRTVNFRRSAMLFDLLERVMMRSGYFVDEFNPKICAVLRLVMLAQAQTCIYYARKGEELAQRLDHAALANAALRYYREAFQIIDGNLGRSPKPEGTAIDQRDLSNPAEHLPRYLKPYCMACGIVIKTSMISHLMDLDKGDTTQHGRIMGNCSRLCAMLRAYSLRVRLMEAHEDVAQLDALKPVYQNYTALEASLEEKNKIFKEAPIHPDVLENEDPEPIDQVTLRNINILDISDGLRQVYTEELMGKFSVIISQEAYRMWSEYRKRKAVMYRVHCQQISEFRARLIAMMESPTARFPLLYLYFVAHSLGISHQCLAPAKTPLGLKTALLIQGDSAWSAFIGLHDNYLAREKGAAEMARNLVIDTNDARTAFESGLSPSDVAQLALDTPLERSKAILEEYRGFKLERASEDVVQWATELRKADTFSHEIRNKTSMPSAFWAQLCDPAQRVPFPQVTSSSPPRESALGARTDGDGLVDEMLSEQLARAQADAKTALKETTSPSSTAPVAGSSKVSKSPGLFSLFGLGASAASSSSSSSSSSSYYRSQEPDNAEKSPGSTTAQKQTKATQFASANPNLKTVKLMRFAVRVIDDIYLQLEDLNDQLATSLIADLAKQNTEIPPSEMASDLVGSKLAWLVKFTSSTDNLVKIGVDIIDEMTRLELTKDAIIEEINSNFGFSSAGGPPAESRCVLLTVCSGVTVALRGYKLCDKIYAEIPKEGAFLSTQCKDMVRLKSRPKKASNYSPKARPMDAQREGHAPPVSAAAVHHAASSTSQMPAPTHREYQMPQQNASGYNHHHPGVTHRPSASSSSSSSQGAPKPFI